MYISKFKITNYKNFRETQEIPLNAGFNLVTGQNSAGKTALLESLELRTDYKAHLSLASLPKPGEHFQRKSEVEFSVVLSGTELRGLTEHLPQVRFMIPPDPGFGLAHPLGIDHQHNYSSQQTLEKVWQWLHMHNRIEFNLRRTTLPGTGSTLAVARRPSHGLYRLNSNLNNPTSLLRQVDEAGIVTFSIQYVDGDIFDQIGQTVLDRIYRFSPERFSLGECIFGPRTILFPDARNLAEVLNSMQPNADRYAAYIGMVQRILPQIAWVSVVPHENSSLRIMVWNLPKSSMRDDLAIPLSECGTGIGQVLSIIYVVFSAPESKVLLIDEPQSFLHPGAARKLIEVLKEFPQHQYVIATHSPIIISAADAPEIIIARQIEGQTKLEVADARSSESLSRFLTEVGAQLSDVFGMDRVIWVEGPTEYEIFSFLLRELLPKLTATVIVPIRNTGDLDGKDAKKFLEMYRTLSSKLSLLPKSVRFLLDREARSDQDLQDLRKLSGNTLDFLPKRMLENYLLQGDVIAKVANQIEGFSEKSVTSADVFAVLHLRINEKKYWAPKMKPAKPDLENPTLNGAMLLDAIFNELSERRVRYEKTRHGPMLAKCMLAMHPTMLNDLKRWLEQMIGSA